MLGRRFAIAGTVIIGDQRGRTLGFPTANINPELGDYPHVVPSNGIYAAWVTTEDGSQHKAAVSIGVRPTFGKGVRLVETFLLNFDGDLYGQRLIIEFISRLRTELKFDGAESLIVQMHKDVDNTRDILSRVAATPAS
jgi:riboflavin kinase/FMN adenylyltransferase